MIHLWHRYGPWTVSDTCAALVRGRWLRMEYRRCRRCAKAQTRQGAVDWHRPPVPDTLKTREPAGLPDDTPDLRILAAEAAPRAATTLGQRLHDLRFPIADAVLAATADFLDCCRTCDRRHQPHADPNRPEFAPSWADPADGHPYRPRDRYAAGIIRKHARSVT